jgi:ectoine hydroxylase-related dioxygenase (phytanoyl-CoA dioxygenase family)/tetratricopeptide (TPR) repeat protein
MLTLSASWSMMIYMELALLLLPSSSFSTMTTFPAQIRCTSGRSRVITVTTSLDYHDVDSSGPTLEETFSAATILLSRLEAQREKPQTSLDLLGNLHAVALALMGFDEDQCSDDTGDISPSARAVELFQYSLDNFGEDPAVRERLSAALRIDGRPNKSAEELFKVITFLEEDGCVDDKTLGMLYLDLGFLIDDIMPLPGAGFELETICDEKDSPKLIFQKETRTVTVTTYDEIIELQECDTSFSSFDCYRNAIRLDPTSGMAHKKLADALAVIGKNEESIKEFEIAAKFLPDDICCATHLHFASMRNNHQVDRVDRPAIPLKKEIKLGGTLNDICIDTADLDTGATQTLSLLAAKFERNGVLVFPGALPLDDVNVLSDKVDEIISSATNISINDGDFSVSDFTDETKAAKRRIHMALPLDNDKQYTKIVSSLLDRLRPLLELILQCDSSDDMLLIGSGFMQTSFGAKGQSLHKDVHHFDRHVASDEEMPESWDCILNGYPRCISIQVQLTDTTAGKMGSLEVLPGSHRPDAGISPSTIARAVREPSNGSLIPIDVVPGTVTVYSSRLWHRGGANESKENHRQFCFFTVTEIQASAPPGLIHTMQLSDVGKWCIGGSGLETR